MALIKSVKGVWPEIGKGSFVAENATITGDVIMGEQCSIWFNAVIRGDVHTIRIGDHVNVQDGAVIHATYKTAPTSIGNYVSIAHGAIVHGCTIHDNVLIGMGAIIMDHVEIGSNSIIAAGAIVTKGTKVEAGSIYAGTPAKKIRDIDPALSEGEIQRIANSYSMYASWYEEEGSGIRDQGSGN